jgi:hypothetical protein
VSPIVDEWIHFKVQLSINELIVIKKEVVVNLVK